jgi:hypothetical protein
LVRTKADAFAARQDDQSIVDGCVALAALDRIRQHLGLTT